MTHNNTNTEKTNAGRQTRSAQYRAARETEAQIAAVFSSSIDDVLSHHARIVMADRARLDREHAAMRAQIDSVFAR